MYCMENWFGGKGLNGGSKLSRELFSLNFGFLPLPPALWLSVMMGFPFLGVKGLREWNLLILINCTVMKS